MMITKKYIIILLLLFAIPTYSQEIKDELQTEIGMHFYSEFNVKTSRIIYSSLDDSYRKHFLQKEGNSTTSKKVEKNNAKIIESIQYLNLMYLHKFIKSRYILTDLIMNSKSDTLNLFFSEGPFGINSGITYWKNNDMDTVYFINEKYFDDYVNNNQIKKRLLVPDQSYKEIPNKIVLNYFYKGFGYRDDKGILHFASSFNEWIVNRKLYPTYAGDRIEISDFLYIKVYIPKENKLKFEFIDFVMFQ